MKKKIKIVLIIISSIFLIFIGILIGYFCLSNKETISKINYEKIINQVKIIKNYKLSLTGEFNGGTIHSIGNVRRENNNFIYLIVEKSNLEQSKIIMDYLFDYETKSILINYYNELDEKINTQQYGNSEELAEISYYDSTNILKFLSTFILDNLNNCKQYVCTATLDTLERQSFFGLLNFATLNAYDILTNEVNVEVKAVISKKLEKIQHFEINIDEKNHFILEVEELV